MGMTCPQCNTHQAVKRNITADFGPALHATDVIASELACGHRVGAEEYATYDKKRRDILKKAAEDKVAIERKANAELAAAFDDIRAKREVRK